MHCFARLHGIYGSGGIVLFLNRKLGHLGMFYREFTGMFWSSKDGGVGNLRRLQQQALEMIMYHCIRMEAGREVRT